MSGDHEHVRICGPWNGRTAWCEIQEHQVQDQSASVPPLPCDNPASALCSFQWVHEGPADQKLVLHLQPPGHGHVHALWHAGSKPVI